MTFGSFTLFFTCCGISYGWSAGRSTGICV